MENDELLGNGFEVQRGMERDERDDAEDESSVLSVLKAVLRVSVAPW